ncbi:MAG: hypothetical protein ACK4UN_14440 [Limisphaerales bacterium]
MRKSVFAFVFLALCISLFLLLAPRSPKDVASESKEAGNRSEATDISPHSSRPRWTRLSGEANHSEHAPDAPSNSIVHGPAEFQKGEHQNVIVQAGIRLGDNASFVPRFNPDFARFGNYISPEQTSPEPFDLVQANIQVANLDLNEVTFELRTKALDGFWSEWNEISPVQMKEPLHLQTPSIAWQYRLTLFAGEPSNSPVVETVSVEPINSKKTSVSASNAR